MTENMLIEQLADAVAKRIVSPIPITHDLWTSKEIAAFLKCTEQQVLNRYAPLPSFPCAIRLPSLSKGQGRPKWEASEVIEWALKFKEKKKK